jgi:hypothetical protein
MSNLIALLGRIADRVNQDAWLVQRGRFVDATVLLDAHGDLIAVRQGRMNPWRMARS